MPSTTVASMPRTRRMTPSMKMGALMLGLAATAWFLATHVDAAIAARAAARATAQSATAAAKLPPADSRTGAARPMESRDAAEAL